MTILFSNWSKSVLPEPTRLILQMISTSSNQILRRPRGLIPFKNVQNQKPRRETQPTEHFIWYPSCECKDSVAFKATTDLPTLSNRQLTTPQSECLGCSCCRSETITHSDTLLWVILANNVLSFITSSDWLKPTDCTQFNDLKHNKRGHLRYYKRIKG